MPDTTPHPTQGKPPTLPPDDVLQALIDQRLPHAQAQAAWQALTQEPARAAAVRAQQADRLALQALHADVLEEVPPTVLQATLARAARRQQTWHSAGRWAGMAAAVLLTFAAGWWGRGLQQAGGSHELALDRQPGRQFSAQASVAHAVYAPEQKHPVEVDASQQQHLVQWLSKRLGRPLKLPDLQAKGYALVGGRLLPGDTGARAQFMYQDAQGQRLTLYLGALPPSPVQTPAQTPGAGQPASAPAPLAAFSFSQEGPVPSFYWVEGDFGYALQAELPRQALLDLALAVYKQL
jgi:anti-sigma factor RsiW